MRFQFRGYVVVLLAALTGQVFPVASVFAQQAGKAAGANKAIDDLTAPIALYPDALIAQILVAAGDFGGVQSFAGWMKQNSSLKGSELQDAAQNAGFDAALVALAPFPQVIQMMVEKPEWTKKLGQAFVADKDTVFDSIQRLRKKAESLGNLKSTPQQTVETQTASNGQQVIVVQPANPQVIYVPQYNPQVVYVSAPPPPPSGGAVVAAAAVSFTMGVIIGANSSHYYHGPYAWHGAAMHHEAWEHRYAYADRRYDTGDHRVDHRYDAREDRGAQRQSNYQQNSSQRQSTRQSNQAQRQDAASNRSAQAQSGAGARQARTSAAATSSFGGGQAPSQRSGLQSGGFSGYQAGASARAQSARGSGSLSSSTGSGGGRGGRRR